MSDKTWRRAVLVLVLLGGACGIATMTWITVTAVQVVSIAEECPSSSAGGEFADFDSDDDARELVGLTEAQIDERFGQSYAYGGEWSRSYWLRSSCGISRYLALRLDDTGVVTVARVIQR